LREQLAQHTSLFVAQLRSSTDLWTVFAGVNVTAIYQDDELTDKETFQVEFDQRTDQWRLRTADDTYWILVESGNGIQSNGNSR